MLIYLFQFTSVIVVLISIITAGDIHIQLISNPNLISYIELFLILIILLSAISFQYFSFRSNKILNKIGRFIRERSFFNYLLIFLFFVFVETFQDLLFVQAGLREILYKAYRILLLDNYSFILFLCVISIIGMILITYLKDIKSKLIQFTNLNKLGVWIIILFFGLIIFSSAFLGFGFQKNNLGLGVFLPINAPLPGIHVMIVLILSLGIWGGVSYYRRKIAPKQVNSNLDIIISILLYLMAVLIWNNIRLDPNPLIGEPTPPNYEIYPISDSLYYSIQADRLNIGNGFESTVEHPMYIFVLAIIKLFVGNELHKIIFAQVLILSFIPVLLYQLVRTLHSRYAGLLVSLLFILRERNSIQLSEVITVTNAKMIMTESISLLFLLLILILFMRWVKKTNQQWKILIPAGGLFGILVMIRFEIISILPFLFLSVLPAFKSRYKYWFQGVLSFGCAFFLIVTPWMIRNWQNTGLLYIDKYESSLQIVEKVKDIINPGIKVDPEVFENLERKSVEQIHVSYYKNAQPAIPVKVAPQIDKPPAYQFYNHFVNDLQQTILYLPSNHQPLLTIGSIININNTEAEEVSVHNGLFSGPYMERYVRSLPYWWTNWNGQIAIRSYLPVFSTILLIAIGLLATFKENRFYSYLLITTFISFIFAYSLYGRSGGRTIYVVDWVTLVFYSIGIVELIGKVLLNIYPATSFFSDNSARENSTDFTQKKSKTWPIVVSGLLIFIVGLAMPIYEGVKPQVYTINALNNKLIDLTADHRIIDKSYQPCSGDEQPNQLCAISGIVLYPRFFQAGDQQVDHRQGSIPDSSFSRMEFYLTGTDNIWTALPTSESNLDLPNESKVILIGSYQLEKMKNKADKLYGRYFKVSQVLVFGEGIEAELLETFSCDGPQCEISQ